MKKLILFSTVIAGILVATVQAISFRSVGDLQSVSAPVVSGEQTIAKKQEFATNGSSLIGAYTYYYYASGFTCSSNFTAKKIFIYVNSDGTATNRISAQIWNWDYTNSRPLSILANGNFGTNNASGLTNGNNIWEFSYSGASASMLNGTNYALVLALSSYESAASKLSIFYASTGAGTNLYRCDALPFGSWSSGRQLKFEIWGF